MRLGIFVTHPIQYFAPMWRRMASTAGMDVVVHFFSDHSVRGGIDPGFGRAVTWDVPVLEGYPSVFIMRDADLERPKTLRMDNAEQFLKDGRFDRVMIHGYTHPFERQVIRASHKLGIRSVMRGDFTDEMPDRGRSAVKAIIRDVYLRWFYPHVDAFCYVGKNAKKHLMKRGVTEDRLFSSPFSVDDELLESQKRNFDRDTIRDEMGIKPDQVAILFSGKLIPRKAPLLLVEACKNLSKLDSVHLILLGDGELFAETKRRAEQYLGERAHFPGFVNQSQLGRYFTAADVFVLPSVFDTWGLVVNEAMQFGLPVIASSRVGSAVDLVEPGVTGAMFKSENAQLLTAALEPFVNDADLRKRAGAAAHAKIAGYSTQACVDGILRALQAPQAGAT